MEEEDSFVGKKVRFDDWMGDDPEGDKQNIDEIFAANKFSKREKKGHLLLQLQRTYKESKVYRSQWTCFTCQLMNAYSSSCVANES